MCQTPETGPPLEPELTVKQSAEAPTAASEMTRTAITKYDFFIRPPYGSAEFHIEDVSGRVSWLTHGAAMRRYGVTDRCGQRARDLSRPAARTAARARRPRCRTFPRAEGWSRASACCRRARARRGTASSSRSRGRSLRASTRILDAGG